MAADSGDPFDFDSDPLDGADKLDIPPAFDLPDQAAPAPGAPDPLASYPPPNVPPQAPPPAMPPPAPMPPPAATPPPATPPPAMPPPTAAASTPPPSAAGDPIPSMGGTPLPHDVPAVDSFEPLESPQSPPGYLSGAGTPPQNPAAYPPPGGVPQQPQTPPGYAVPGQVPGSTSYGPPPGALPPIKKNRGCLFWGLVTTGVLVLLVGGCSVAFGFFLRSNAQTANDFLDRVEADNFSGAVEFTDPACGLTADQIEADLGEVTDHFLVGIGEFTTGSVTVAGEQQTIVLEITNDLVCSYELNPDEIEIETGDG